MASRIEEALAAILTATYGEEVRQALYDALLEALTIKANVETAQNKSQDIDVDSDSTTKYPSVKAVEDYLSTYYASAEDVAGQIENINGRMELKENKSQDIDVDSNSTTKYPSVKAVVNKISKYFKIDETTTEPVWRADNYKIIYLNATLRNLNKKAIVITVHDAYWRQFGFCEDGSVYTRKTTSSQNYYEPNSWVDINADIKQQVEGLEDSRIIASEAISNLQNNKVDNETFTEFQGAVADQVDTFLEYITNLENASTANKNAVADVKAYIGYTDSNILGVCVDFKSNQFTRLAGAVGLSAGADFDAFNMYGGRKRVFVAADGTIDWSLSPTEFDEGSAIYEQYDVMVYQPKFYYKMVPLKLEKQTGNGMGYHIRKANYYISATPHAGFKLYPLFYDASGNEIDYVLLSAYEASYLYWDATSQSTGSFKYYMDGVDTDTTIATNDVLKSVPYVKPISSGRKELTVDGMERVAQQKSTNWHLETIQAVSANQLLMLIEYATFDLQSIIGRGIVQHNYTNGAIASLTGSTVSLGDVTGMAPKTIYNYNGVDTDQTANGKVAVTYRGVENPWGNIWKQIQGVNIWGDGSMNGGQPYVCTNFSFSSSKHSDNYVGVGFTVANRSNYTSAFGYGSETFDWLFIPSETLGDNVHPVCDNCFVTENNAGDKRVNYGGRSDLNISWAQAGAYAFATNSGQGHRASNMGGRLLYVPDAKGVS